MSRSADRINIPYGPKDNPFMFAQSMAALISDHRIVPCIAEFEPGRSGEEFQAQEISGVEMIYVIEGSVGVRTAQASEVLNAHDILWIDSSLERRYSCADNVMAKALILSAPFNF